ncbi:hypothetical protein V8D89_004759 [Ganoderma adspersum]
MPAKKGKKRPASPTRPKGPRGNHAAVISDPPPTPPRKKAKTKHKQVESEAESEHHSEPPRKKKKGPKKASTEPKRTGVEWADPDLSESDRHSGQASSGGKHSGKTPDTSSAPHSSSPLPSGSSRAPRSSSHSSAPLSDKTVPSARTAPSCASANNASSGGASSQHPPRQPNTSSDRAVPIPAIAPNALENAANAFKALADTTRHDLDLGNFSGQKKVNVPEPICDEDMEDDGEEEEEGEEDGSLNLEDEQPKQARAKPQISLTDAEADAAAEDEDGDEDEDEDEDELEDAGTSDEDDEDVEEDVEEELSKEEVVSFMKLIQSRKDDKYTLTYKESDSTTVPGHFKKWARHAHRLCSIYTDIHSVILTGMTVVKANPKTATDYQECYKHMPNMTAKAVKFYTTKFFHLCNCVPKFKLLCQYLLSWPRGMFHFAKFFEVHASAGHSSDIATLKRSFHSYLPTVYLDNGTCIPPLTVNQYTNLKSRNAGYYSDCSARLIVPINERDAFDEEPHEYAKHKNAQRREQDKEAARPKKHHKNDRPKPADGSIDDQKTFPSFLFPTLQEYDGLNPQRGIFKGDLCLTAAHHLFKGPSSVGRNDGLPGFGWDCLAKIYKIKHFTPDLLAYVATLVRHLLSVDARWQKESAERIGHHFHTALHTILTVDYEAWKEDRDRADNQMHDDDDNDDDDDDDIITDENIFSYYNRCIYGTPWGDPETQVVAGHDLVDTDDEDNLRACMLAARKAELAARHHPRVKKGKQRASSLEQHEQRARDPSVEFVERPPPSEGSAGDDVGGAGASGSGDHMPEQ